MLKELDDGREAAFAFSGKTDRMAQNSVVECCLSLSLPLTHTHAYANRGAVCDLVGDLSTDQAKARAKPAKARFPIEKSHPTHSDTLPFGVMILSFRTLCASKLPTYTIHPQPQADTKTDAAAAAAAAEADADTDVTLF